MRGESVPGAGAGEAEQARPLKLAVGLGPKGQVLDEVSQALLSGRVLRGAHVDHDHHRDQRLGAVFLDDDAHPGGKHEVHHLEADISADDDTVRRRRQRGAAKSEASQHEPSVVPTVASFLSGESPWVEDGTRRALPRKAKRSASLQCADGEMRQTTPDWVQPAAHLGGAAAVSRPSAGEARLAFKRALQDASGCACPFDRGRGAMAAAVLSLTSAPLMRLGGTAGRRAQPPLGGARLCHGP